jgi:ABC-type branched-subunit amino acid transport system substrate-binding protein/DNA-binding beta-propeller fold protein YncE/predicted Ser/Thr protein kinase
MSEEIGPGSTFGGYRVEEVIGRGGMGVVFRAIDLSLERPVALKLIVPDLVQDERFRERFLKEPRRAASLDHPNVIPIYEAGERDGQLYLAMRYVEGSDLRTVVTEEGPLEPERALNVLGQIASALDAAHRRGLVHRDVKPANILLDEDAHAYLTDFGITKQLGDAATDTGQMVGTLDYIAPEQIRGEGVDGRSDCYALACVLYQCLAGTPPFRRASEAETLWAHMQDEPPSLRGHPALDPVLRKGLAKQKNARHATCAELIEDARQALGLTSATTVRRMRMRRVLTRRRRPILAAGVVVLAAAIAAALLQLGGGDGESEALGVRGNGVAAVDPGGGEVASFTEFATAPSNIAVGEGAVWVLNTQNETVSRIDPKTKAVTARFTTPGVPSDIAAGEGALWIGQGGGEGANYPLRVARIDPRTHRVTRSVKLPDKTGELAKATFNWGFADIVVGAGAVWTRNPDHTISRIDPKTGRLVQTIDVEADAIAAGKEGVWFLAGSTVTEIDPRTNRVRQRIPISTPAPTAIAVGAGKVWVSAAQQGVVWSVQPGPGPVAKTVDVGVGVTYIAFGAGAAWTANYLDGKLTRIDPGSGRVISRTSIGSAQALAAGAGAAWVSTAGGTETGTLPAGVCGDVASAGREPDVLIASDLPLQGPNAAPRAIDDAIEHVLRRHDFRAGKYAVGYRACDDSTAQTGNWENRRCAANANAYAYAKELVALIGPYNSDCAQIEIPILNRAPGGPLAMISPANTHPGLTRRTGPPSPAGYRGEPDVYYPSGKRNYVRLVPGDDLQGAAHAVLARRLRLRSVYVLDDASEIGRDLMSRPFKQAAAKLGVGIAGNSSFDPDAASYRVVADRVARSHAAGVVIGGDQFAGGRELIKALRARLGPRFPIMVNFLFAPIPKLLKGTGGTARGVYLATIDLARATLPLTAAGRSFARDIGAPATQFLGVLEAGQAAELVLAAIARSDGTRGSVLRELQGSEVKDGILGSFRFDRNGDISEAAIPILRVTGDVAPGTKLPRDFQGAEIETVIRVPSRLVG